jgi:hypothetical protein
MKWLTLVLLVFVGCGRPEAGRKPFPFQDISFGYDSCCVVEVEFMGRKYHVFDGTHSMFVIDVTKNSENPKISAEKD